MNVARLGDEARLFIHSKMANANALLSREVRERTLRLQATQANARSQMWHN